MLYQYFFFKNPFYYTDYQFILLKLFKGWLCFLSLLSPSAILLGIDLQTHSHKIGCPYLLSASHKKKNLNTF